MYNKTNFFKSIITAMILALMPFAAQAQATWNGSGTYNATSTRIVELTGTNNGIMYVSSGVTVTITGSLSGMASGIDFSFSDETAKVVWQADLRGSFEIGSLTHGMVRILGNGVFEMNAGSIIQNGNACALLSINAADSKIIINGGIISSTILPAIYLSNPNQRLTINGGTVSTTVGRAIFATYSSTTITVAGGIVEATGAGGNAIVSRSTAVVTGGTVRATTGYAFTTTLAGEGIVEVEGGLVFAYGTTIPGGVIDPDVNSYTLNNTGGNGVVVAWDNTAFPGPFVAGDTDGLTFDPAGATVNWAIDNSQHGISYSNGLNTGFIPLPVTVNGPMPLITSANSTTVISGTGGTFQVTATGYGMSYSLTTQPAGVSINSTSGLITISASTAAGIYPFTIKASNSVGDDTQTFTLTVNAPPVTPPSGTAPRISGPSSLTLTKGYVATSTSVYTITGTAPVTVLKLSGDDKISWNSTTRQLDIAAGLAVGIYEVRLRATNSAGSHTFTFVLTVEEKVYYLDIPRTVTGGTITTATDSHNPFLATEGSTVTLTLTPDEGYELASITVYHYGTDKPVPFVKTDNDPSLHIRTFIMPAGHITVAVTFRPIKTAIAETLHTTSLQAYTQGGVLYISGLSQGSTWKVYNIFGTLIQQGMATENVETLRATSLPHRGLFIITDEKTAVKVMN
jgi:hypothetical protein